MLETTSQSSAGNRSARWPRPVAVGSIAVVVATPGWAGYRMLDPVGAEQGGGLTCYSTQTPGATPGAITTLHLGVKQGHTVTVRSVDLLDSENIKLAGAGVQQVLGGIGVDHYPVETAGTAEQTAWKGRTELPAALGAGAEESVIFAFEPLEPGAESSFGAVRVGYSSQWGLPYSTDLALGFEAKPNCLLEDADEEEG